MSFNWCRPHPRKNQTPKSRSEKTKNLEMGQRLQLGPNKMAWQITAEKVEKRVRKGSSPTLTDPIANSHTEKRDLSGQT